MSRIRSGVIWVSLLLLLAPISCGVSSSGRKSDGKVAGSTTISRDISPDDLLKYSNRWINNVAIDLMAPEGTFIRAFVESMQRIPNGRGRGLDALEDAGYPGFAKVFQRYFAETLHQLQPNLQMWGRGTHGPGYPVVGTNFYEVVNLHRNGEMYSATVCTYSSLQADDLGNGSFSSLGKNSWNTSGGNTYIFGPDVNLPPDKQRNPEPNQHGSAAKPHDNVFGTWVLAGMEPISETEHSALCNALAPGTPDDWPVGSYDHKYIRTTPPPTLPPSPGWPK